jgi:hypothetical protein
MVLAGILAGTVNAGCFNSTHMHVGISVGADTVGPFSLKL